MAVPAGPTKGAQNHEEVIDRWKSHPRLALLLRALILVLPIATSLGFTMLAGWLFPAEDLGVGRWTWTFIVFVLANLLLLALRRLASRLLPLVALMKLTLVFPDHAPSRAKASLRKSNSRTMLRTMEEAIERGETGGAVEHGDYLVQLLKEVNEHDRLTRGHSERVRAYAEMIGEELGFNDHDMNLLRWSALLHDVGKISVPSEILNKNGKPTGEEWKVLANHPAAGAEMLEPLRPWLGDWIHSADQHHCRWDGNGYPEKLKAKEITLAGRLVAIADAYDVMTSARSYKKPLGPELARQELTTCAGSQFDPTLVRAFLQIGLSRLKAVAGPLGWLANLTGSLQLPTATAGAATTGAISATVASAGIAVATLTGLGAPSEPDAPVLAFDDPVPIVEIEDGFKDLLVEPVTVDVDEGTPIEIVVRANGGAGALDFSVTNAEHGSVSIIEDPNPTDTELVPDAGGGWEITVRYTPNTAFFGQDTFTLEVCDTRNVCESHRATIEVVSTNRAPVTNEDQAAVEAGRQITIDVLGNDRDPDGDQLHLTSVGPAGNGKVQQNGPRITYEASDDYSGIDEFIYTIADTENSQATGRVTITVIPTTTTTTPPSNAAPLVVDDVADVDEDGTVLIPALINDRDPNNDTLTIVGLTKPDHGNSVVENGQIRYTPAANYNGADSLTYVVTDGRTQSNGTVDITVTPINDNPVATSTGLTILETAAPGTSAFSIDATDIDGDPLSYTIVSGNTEGIFNIDANGAGTTLTSVDFETQALHRLDISVSDGTSTIPVFVDVTIADVNETPAAGDDLVAIEEDSAAIFALGANDFDPDADTFTWQIPATTNAGTPLTPAGGDVAYTPPPDFNGADGFTYTITDPEGLVSPPATVTIMVMARNDPPVAADDAGIGFTTSEDAWITTSNVTTNDTDPDNTIDTASITVLTNVSNGTLTNNGNGTFDYTPTAGWSGTDTFTYTISDGNLSSNTATVTLTVTPDNDAPVVTNPGNQSAPLGASFSVQIIATDVEFDGLSYGATGLPPGLSIDTDGLISGTATLGGTYTVQVTVTDDGTPPRTDSATFDIIVDGYAASSLAGDIVITEVFYVASAAPTQEMVELYNAGATAIDLTGWIIADHDRQNDAPEEIDYSIPATDHFGNTSTLQPGEHAVVWVGYDGVNNPPFVNSATGLEYRVSNGAGRKLGLFGDSLWLLESPTLIVDYMAYLNGDGDTSPPASLSLWDATNQASIFSWFDRSISLSPHGVDGNTASCWEETRSGDAAARCPGAPATIDTDVGARRWSPGSNNNTAEFGAHVMISEFSNVGGAAGNDDFIELYNPTAAPIDIEGWQLEIANDVSIVQTLLLTGPNTILPAGGHYLLNELGTGDQTLVAMPAALAIRISQGGTPVDEVGTAERLNSGSVAPGLWNEGTGVPPLVDVSGYTQSWERLVGLGVGNCTDTNDNAADFEHRFNAAVNPQSSSDPTELCATLPTPTAPGHLVVTEFRTDGPNGGKDELVEIFNPTSATISLSGYELRRAGTSSVKYTFPAVDLAPGQHYLTGSDDYLGPVDGIHSGFANGDGGVDLYYANTSSIVDSLTLDGTPPNLPPLDGQIDQTYSRRAGGCQDTDAMTSDFFLTGSPTPTTTGDAAVPC